MSDPFAHTTPCLLRTKAVGYTTHHPYCECPCHARRFGPKPADHPSIGQPCAACRRPFVAGDHSTLIALGPGDDPDEQRRARERRPYTAEAVEVHWTCATGVEAPADDRPNVLGALPHGV